VGNYEFDDEAEPRVIARTGETYLGRIDYDASVKDYNLKGESLLNLPESSPACLSVKKILEKAGYRT
jgi:CO dehydrogenase nickel-insertion accessory protein CooC1